jgi:hypothetical protein
MISLTPDEKRLRDFLAAALAAQADPSNPEACTITYKDLAVALDPDGSIGWKHGHPRYTRLITALYHINTYEVEHGRPMVGAFVVHVTDGRPGTGFAALGRQLGRLTEDGEDAEYAFWLAEMDASVEYWSAATAETAKPGLTDTQFDAIMAELSTIKQMLRQLLHG